MPGKFINNNFYSNLSLSEVEYWKIFFEKIIKIGIEFEVQFPTVKPIFGRAYCEDDSNCSCGEERHCDLVEGCLHDSLHEDNCPILEEEFYDLRIIRNYCFNNGRTFCNHMCGTCSHFSFRCNPNGRCKDFKIPCIGCKKYKKLNCDSCDKSIDTVESSIKRLLPPSNSTDIVGSGVLNVIEDGSVPNGIEVITVGRRYMFESMYELNNKIIKKLLENNGYISWYCSTHLHILAGYTKEGVQELERPVPQIILANYYQLHNIFAPYLFWLTSSGEVEYGLTRYTIFRQPLFDFSVFNSSGMRGTKDIIYNIFQRYSMFNMSNLSFDINNLVNKFHVEARYPDGNLSPSCVTAYACLELALLMKAIEISKYGVIDFHDNNHKEFIKHLFDEFANFGTGDRDSDTENFYYNKESFSSIKEGAKDMLKFLKGQIINLDKYSYSILTKLAEEPPSIMRTKGLTWQQIEESLDQKFVYCDNTQAVIEIIELQKAKNSRTLRNWEIKVSNILNIDLRSVQKIMRELRQIRELSFDADIGQPIFKN